MLKNNYKTALVTGASSGIGEETVKLLVKNNIKVYAVARRKNKLIKLEKTTGCIPIVMDIRDRKALEKLKNDPTVMQAMKAFDGTLDLESVSPIDN